MTGFWAWFHDGWEIVGALAAAGAVIVALWLARHERADREKAEDARDAAEGELRAERAATREAARRNQAEHITAWFEQRLVGSVANIATNSIDEEYAPTLRLGNFSAAPVFDVRVTLVRLHDNQTARRRRMVLPPTEDALLLDITDTFSPFDEDIDVRMEFRDVAGVQWVRYSDGRLAEQPGED